MDVTIMMGDVGDWAKWSNNVIIWENIFMRNYFYVKFIYLFISIIGLYDDESV